MVVQENQDGFKLKEKQLLKDADVNLLAWKHGYSTWTQTLYGTTTENGLEMCKLHTCFHLANRCI